MRFLESKPQVLILETRNLPAIDTAGLRAIEDLIYQLSRRKIHFLISGVHEQPRLALQQMGRLDRLA